MKLKVSHDALEMTSFEVLGSANEFDEILKIWNSNMVKLSSIWQGEDANEFYLNVGMYLEKLKEVPKFYAKMSEFLKDANIKYRTADEESSKEFLNKLMEIDVNAKYSNK